MGTGSVSSESGSSESGSSESGSSESGSSEQNPYDVVVVGLGAMGAATAYQAAKLGLSVLGIDRHRPPHTFGSTHAETRVTRLAVGEGEQYLPFVRRSHEIWRELEEHSGEPLLYQGGVFIITDQRPTSGQRWHDFVTTTDRIARGAGIEFHVLDPSTDRAACPPLRGLEGKRVGFEPTAGVVMAERALALQLKLAEEHGAELHMQETVTAVRPNSEGVEVVTNLGRYRAEKVVLATGPWIGDLADPMDAEILSVTRQVVYWFEVDDVSAFSIDAFPVVMWIGESDEEYVGIFPIPPNGIQALKILGEQFVTTTHPESVDRTVSQDEIDGFYTKHIAPRLGGVSNRCVKAEVCLYTNTPDDHFLIDSSPSSDRITVVSPCSGHGFKHSAALGEALAQQIGTGRSELDLTPFRRKPGYLPPS